MTTSTSDPIARLEQMMRPAGGGLHVVTTGLAEQRALQRTIYKTARDEDIEARWRDALVTGCRDANVVIIGAPHDCGAGFTRGSNRGPGFIRQALLNAPQHAYHAANVIDMGDIRVVPHLLADDMLSETQLRSCRDALYGEPNTDLPVSPLDLCAEVLRLIRASNPSAIPIILGGDHSLGWPGFETARQATEAVSGRRLGVLQIDAHTDLLAHRMGVKYCFGTWAYHANDALGRDGRLVQVGVRVSGYDRAHWETTLGVRQLRAHEVLERDPNELAHALVEHFHARGVTHLYLSHDIDGTDPAFAGATGTPEPDGLHPAWVRTLVQSLCRALPLVGADLVEVAPPLAWGSQEEPERTLQTALDYLDDMTRPGLENA